MSESGSNESKPGSQGLPGAVWPWDCAMDPLNGQSTMCGSCAVCPALAQTFYLSGGAPAATPAYLDPCGICWTGSLCTARCQQAGSNTPSPTYPASPHDHTVSEHGRAGATGIAGVHTVCFQLQ